MTPLRPLLLLAALLAVAACTQGPGGSPVGAEFPEPRSHPAVGPGNPVSRGMAG